MATKQEIIDAHTETRDKALSSDKYDYFHMIRSPNQVSITVKGYDTYPNHSVLAGQTRINFIDSFELYEEPLMLKLWGEKADWSSKYIEPQNTFNHLSDNGDDW